MKSRRKLTSVVLLSVVLLGACGGDDSDSAFDTVGQSTSSGTSSGTASGSSSDTPEFKGNNSGDFCKYAKQIEDDEAFGDSFLESTDAKTMKDDLKKAQDIYGTAISKAPSEIKPDMQVMQKALKALGDLLATYDFDMSKMTAAMAKDPSIATKMEAFSSDEFQKSSERVDAYFSQVCGIDTE